MRPLLIDDNARQNIARLVEFADAHRLSAEEMQRRVANGGPSIGDDPRFSCEIPFGFRVVFSIEQQPMGWCRHLSVSVDHPDRMPSIPAVKMIMEAFGYKQGLDESIVHIEDDISPKAINILAPI